MEVVKREDLPHDYDDLVEIEADNDHVILMIDGVLRWKENPDRQDFDLNEVEIEAANKGITRSDERYRKIYRDIGFSLSGYCNLCYSEEEF